MSAVEDDEEPFAELTSGFALIQEGRRTDFVGWKPAENNLKGFEDAAFSANLVGLTAHLAGEYGSRRAFENRGAVIDQRFNQINFTGVAFAELLYQAPA